VFFYKNKEFYGREKNERIFTSSFHMFRKLKIEIFDEKIN